MAASIRATLVITGRVQGVFYRTSAMQEAQRLNIVGSIQNLPDGAVEAIVEGEEQAVQQFVAWCRVGSPNSQVDDVDVRFGPAKDEFRTFSVAR